MPDDATVRREAAILMRKVRYLLEQDWEFERLARYLREHPQEMADAAAELSAEDLL